MTSTSTRLTGAALVALMAAGALGSTAASAADSAGHPGRRVQPVQLLSFNDLHGNLQPPTGSGGRVTLADGTVVDAGGAAYLATHINAARDRAPGASFTVSVADNVGASPFLSAAFYDEPTIEAMNLMDVDVSTVGNHEFDLGFAELRRKQRGGCLENSEENARLSCADDWFDGADFPMVAANVFRKGTNRHALPPYVIRTVNGVRVAFVGAVLEQTPSIVSAAGIKDLEFRDEVASINAVVPQIERKGVKAIVAVVHQGGTPSDNAVGRTCGAGGTLSGPIVPIAQTMSPQVDLIMSAHTHNTYICSVPDPAGQPRLVTSAASYGRLLTETTAPYDRARRDFVRRDMKAVNHVVTRTVQPDREVQGLIDRYTALVGPIASTVVGKVTEDITADRTGVGVSELGALVADAQLADPTVVTGGQKPVIAFMNPGGIRADLTYAQAKGEGDGVVTYEEAFTVQPFNNYLVSMTLTGADIHALLAQQWADPAARRFLQTSAGFTYTIRPAAGGAFEVVPGTVRLGGVAVPNDASASYRVVTNSFLADGGDGFTTFRKGTGVYYGGLDIDAFTAYLGTRSPYTPPRDERVTVLR